MRHARPRPVLPALLVPLLAAAAAAQDGTPSRAGHFDADTGRNLLNYPPHRAADHLHMRLEITIPDMNEPVMDCRSTITLAPIGRPLDVLVLDAKLLDIASVACAGHDVTFSHDAGKLSIAFDPPVPPGESRDIVTAYTVNDPPDGLYWFPESDAWPGRPAQLHSQGQCEFNSYWFPCHDFPNERLTTELIVTVPAGFTAISNGRLVSRSGEGVEVSRLQGVGGAGSRALDASTPRQIGASTFHWLQDKPHPYYLVTLVVGEFDVVDVGTRRLPMPVHVPPGRGGDVRGSYGRTPEMVRLFERVFDEPYPWDRYAQVVVWNFLWGGMENTAATTMFDTAIIERGALMDTDLDGLISHELAHQWFGDLVTCNSWEHIWLNEGFATFAEALWFEHAGGPAGYAAEIRGNFDAVIENDRGVAPFAPGMVSKEYAHPDDVFDRAANPYSKGASVLHMLRRRLGDEVFFRAVAEYVDRHKLATVETRDLRLVFEEVSGENLERFFRQWCERPGIPRLNIRIAWAAGELVLRAEQTQEIDGSNPAFAFALPVTVVTRGGAVRRAALEMETREAELRLPLADDPRVVAIDPDMDVLAELTITQPRERWLAQLERGPGLNARVQAARALANDGSAAGRDALAGLVGRSREHRFLRREAAAALGERGETSRLLDLARRAPSDPYVRESIALALAAAAEGSPDKGRAADQLASIAQRDRSQLVRAAALRGLGTLGAHGHMAVVMAAAGLESQHDRLRHAALDALADLDRPEGLPVAIRLTREGYLSDTRAAAIRAAARLGHHDRGAAYRTLSGLLRDREPDTARAAGGALADLGDERGAADLRALLDEARDEWTRSRVQRWLDDLMAKLAAPAPGH